jgi:hypothetical protein
MHRNQRQDWICSGGHDVIGQKHIFIAHPILNAFLAEPYRRFN